MTGGRNRLEQPDTPESADEEDTAEERKEDTKLEWRDYVALFWASLETVFLPTIIFIVIILILVIFLGVV